MCGIYFQPSFFVRRFLSPHARVSAFSYWFNTLRWVRLRSISPLRWGRWMWSRWFWKPGWICRFGTGWQSVSDILQSHQWLKSRPCRRRYFYTFYFVSQQNKTALGVAARGNMVIIVDMIVKAERYFKWKDSFQIVGILLFFFIHF